MTTITVAQYEAEICRLHDFFQVWFRGDIAQSEENFQLFAAVGITPLSGRGWGI